MWLKHCHTPAIWEGSLPTISGDLGDGLLSFEPHYIIFTLIDQRYLAGTHQLLIDLTMLTDNVTLTCPVAMYDYH